MRPTNMSDLSSANLKDNVGPSLFLTKQNRYFVGAVSGEIKITMENTHVTSWKLFTSESLTSMGYPPKKFPFSQVGKCSD